MIRNSDDYVYPFDNQDFISIRDWCIKRGYLFEDPYFKLENKYIWRRPWEICSEPRLFVGGTTQFDVVQGKLGNCWMLAAIATLGMYPDLVRQVIPEDQSFTYQYAGVFHFRFWNFGKWFDVVIDDRLPTKKGKLVFTRSTDQNEFWTALLEKAYCKIIGREYRAADEGNLCEALEDFTGGIVEQFLLRSVPRNFPDILLKATRRHSLVGCFIDDLPGQYQAPTPQGLVRGHSYSVTAAEKVNLPGYGSIVLVRVRNPWGKFEWTGPWSDSSPEWASVPQSTKQELGLVHQEDGEFWMSYSDFVSNFQWADMCHLGPETFSGAYGSDSVSSWQLTKMRGSWVRGVTAGGARYLHKNPQIRFTLSDADDDNNDSLCSVLIALLQRPNGRDPLNHSEIGFKVYQLQGLNYDNTTLDRNFFQNNRSVANVPAKRVREVAGRFNLPPGDYCLIPFTYEPQKEAEFLVRIYSEKKTDMNQMDRRIGLSPLDLKADETPPMGLGEEESEEDDESLQEFFKNVSGKDKEIGWKELKNLLDVVMKNQISPPEKNDSWGHFLMNAANFIYGKIFGLSVFKHNAFQTIGPEGFSNDVCRSMLAMLDVNHSGKLCFSEFKVLWSEIKMWKSIYEKHSEENDGYLNSCGLEDAFGSAGFRFSRQVLTDIVHRYTTDDGKITFNDFLHCGIKIKIMSEFFKSNAGKDPHKAEFTLEEFIDKAIYS